MELGLVIEDVENVKEVDILRLAMSYQNVQKLMKQCKAHIGMLEDKKDCNEYLCCTFDIRGKIKSDKPEYFIINLGK